MRLEVQTGVHGGLDQRNTSGGVLGQILDFLKAGFADILQESHE